MQRFNHVKYIAIAISKFMNFCCSETQQNDSLDIVYMTPLLGPQDSRKLID